MKKPPKEVDKLTDKTLSYDPKKKKEDKGKKIEKQSNGK